MECKGANRVELLQLQKAAAGFEYLEDTKLGREAGKVGSREAGRACVHCTTVRGSKARRGGCMQGKPTCWLVFAAESPWDAFTVLTACPAGWRLHSDSGAMWNETLKITFKGKKCAMCTFLMQRLSPRGFGECSIRAPGALARYQLCQSPQARALSCWLSPAAGHSSQGG